MIRVCEMWEKEYKEKIDITQYLIKELKDRLKHYKTRLKELSCDKDE